MLDAGSAALVLDVLGPEREALLATLAELSPEEWARPTECPAYTVKGITTHILGDDLSLLARQRDGAENGLLQVAAKEPGVDFRTLLDTFNDRWVAAARFLSPELVIELLRLTGEWTVAYHHEVDPMAPGEPVGFFGAEGATSPAWQAMAREYVERWVHHSQIRRALDLGSLADVAYLRVGVEVAAAAAGVEAGVPDRTDGTWSLGPVVLGPASQAADVLTRAHPPDAVRRLVSGPPDAVELVASFAGRP